MEDKTLKVYTDGGAKGNPGPASIGVIIIDSQGKEYLRLSKNIGVTTNNFAEYQAVISALEWLRKNQNNLREFEKINFFLDSKLVVNQLNGIYKIKNFDLKNQAVKVKTLEKSLPFLVRYSHIPREENKIADFLVNQSS